MTSEEYIAFDPDWTVPPGEMLAEALEENGLTPDQLAHHLSLPLAHITSLIAGEAPLTHDDALALHYALGIPAHLWERMEANYRSDLAAGRKYYP